MSGRLARLFALQCSIAACGGAGTAPCTKDEQCASHFCRADGTCGPAITDAPLAIDAPAGDATTMLCMPNHDGTISAAELPLAAGKSASFRIAINATWSTAGTANPDGSRTWDLSGQLSGDMTDQVALAAPGGAWWAADFPGASYATTLSASSELIGVFAIDAAGLTLLGVVSPSGGATSTELTYDPPAQILRVPFKAGDTWSTTSTVSGTASGVPGAYSEEYASHVDHAGTLTTPYGAFPVLRIATDLTRSAGPTVLTTNRTFTWAAECAGIVATVQSQSFETHSEFSDDAEVRRLAP
jgi:hypothetical protein